MVVLGTRKEEKLTAWLSECWLYDVNYRIGESDMGRVRVVR